MKTLLLTAFSLSLWLPLHADDKATPYAGAVKVQTLAKAQTNSAGQKIEYPKGDAEVSILIVTIAPGGQTGWHRHPVPLFGYVLEGQVTVQLGDGKKETFQQGAPLLECVNMLHNGTNEGTTPTRLLIVVAGEKDVPFTKKATTDKDGHPLGDYESHKEARPLVNPPAYKGD